MDNYAASYLVSCSIVHYLCRKNYEVNRCMLCGIYESINIHLVKSVMPNACKDF